MWSVGSECVIFRLSPDSRASSQWLLSGCVRGDTNHDDISPRVPHVMLFTTHAVELGYVELRSTKMIQNRMQVFLLIHVSGLVGMADVRSIRTASEPGPPTMHTWIEYSESPVPRRPTALPSGHPWWHSGTGCLPTDARLRSTYASGARWPRGWSRTWIFTCKLWWCTQLRNSMAQLQRSETRAGRFTPAVSIAMHQQEKFVDALICGIRSCLLI